MKINTYIEENVTVVELSGRLDTSTAPEAESQINKACLSNNVIIDIKDLEYISSAGLRVILLAQKAINAKEGKMSIRNCNDDIYEIFEMTGFTDVIDIEH